MKDFLVFENISKSFGRNQVLHNINLSIEKGEVFSLLGPSGCGKTTLLRICAGLESPDTGRVFLDGRDITGIPPHKRKVNTVFQTYALFPHLSVWENIAFGLKIARVDSRKIKNDVENFLDLIQMTDHADKMPSQLSGGMKQRVAIARALINRPGVLLLDEPLAALDLKLRQRMLVELDNIHDEVGITFLYVTHDQNEAMSLSDHVAIMNEGKIEQSGVPVEVYEAPETSFVAAFIGDTNFFDGVVAEHIRHDNDDYVMLNLEGFPRIIVYNDKKLLQGQPVHVSVRPEKIGIFAEKPVLDPALYNIIEGKVEEIIYLGHQTKYWVRVQDYLISVSRQHDQFITRSPITWGDSVWISWHADNCYMLEKYREADESLLVLPDEEYSQLETLEDEK